MRVINFEEPIKKVLNRVEDQLTEFLLTFPDNKLQIERFVNDLQIFYAQEIKKLKLWVLSEIHDSIKKEIENCSIDFQNKFFEERIKQKLEDDVSRDYQPEMVDVPPTKTLPQKIAPGASIACCTGLVGLLIAGSGMGLSKALAIILLMSAGGGAISRNYFKVVEKDELKKVLGKYIAEERDKLIDFSKSIVWRYEKSFDEFKERYSELI